MLNLRVVWSGFVGSIFCTLFFCLFLCGPYLGHCFLIFRGCTALGRYSIFSVVQFYMECIQNQVLVPLGGRATTTFVKHEFFAEIALRDNHR